MDVRRHRCGGIGRSKAAHNGVDRSSSISNDEHERDDSTTGAVRRGWEVDLSIAGAIWVNGVAPVLRVMEPIFVSRTGNWYAIGYDVVHLFQPTTPIEVSHSYAVAVNNSVGSKD